MGVSPVPGAEAVAGAGAAGAVVVEAGAAAAGVAGGVALSSSVSDCCEAEGSGMGRTTGAGVCALLFTSSGAALRQNTSERRAQWSVLRGMRRSDIPEIYLQ